MTRQASPRFMLICFFGMLLPAAGTDSGAARLPVAEKSSRIDYNTELEHTTFEFINQYRKVNQLPLLVWNDSIASIARAHSKDMADSDVSFGHDGFDERASVLKAVLSNMVGCGENVLKTEDPDQVALWLRSPPHLHNIRGDYNYSGLGVSLDKSGVIYFTQIFVKIESPEDQNQPPPKPKPKFVWPFHLFAPTTPPGAAP